MHDPGLRVRLADVEDSCFGAVERDRIVDLESRRRFAASVPGARFEAVMEAGHLPHVVKPDEVLELIRVFVARTLAFAQVITEPR